MEFTDRGTIKSLNLQDLLVDLAVLIVDVCENNFTFHEIDLLTQDCNTSNVLASLLIHGEKPEIASLCCESKSLLTNY
jgi:hypothetical protein